MWLEAVNSAVQVLVGVVPVWNMGASILDTEYYEK